jgi:hypothetical protein
MPSSAEPLDRRQSASYEPVVIAGFQDALVALATDRALRRRFAMDGEAALAAFALEPRAKAALLAIPFEALDRYASSLEVKRWDEVARVVRHTLKIVPGLPQLYRAWLGAHPAPAVDGVQPPGVAEALRAMPAMRAALATDEHAVYVADLYTYETFASARLADVPRGFASRFALHAIVRELDAGVIPIDPDPAPYVYRFEPDRIRWRPA